MTSGKEMNGDSVLPQIDVDKLAEAEALKFYFIVQRCVMPENLYEEEKALIAELNIESVVWNPTDRFYMYRNFEECRAVGRRLNETDPARQIGIAEGLA